MRDLGIRKPLTERDDSDPHQAIGKSTDSNAATEKGTQAGAGHLLGRGDELSMIDDAISRVIRKKTGEVLVFEGAAGIGKTQILSHAMANGMTNGFVVASCAGIDLEQDYAWGVVRRLFGRLAASERTYSAGSRLGLQLVLGQQEIDASKHAEYAHINSIYWLTADVAETQPLLIVVDDMHWADVASLRFLAYLIGRLEGTPILIVGAQRPGDHPVSQLLNTITDRHGVMTHILRPFTSAEATELLNELRGSSPCAYVVARCVELTGGNPLLIRELGRQLAQATQGSFEEVLGAGVPGIERYVRLQTSRLPGTPRAVLEALAVLGDGASVNRVAAVAGVPIAELLASLSTLKASELISHSLQEAESLSIRHPLIRLAVYDGMKPAQRADLHLAATKMALKSAEPEKAAGHLLRLPPGYADIDVANVLKQAADGCITRGAVDSAVTFMRRRLDEDLGEERVGALSQLAEFESQVDSEQALLRYRALLEMVNDEAGRESASIGLATTLFFSGRIGEAQEVLRPLLEHVDGRRDDRMKAIHALALLVGSHRSDHGELPVLLERLGNLPYEPTVGASMLDGALGLLYAFGGQRERALKHAHRALADLEFGSEQPSDLPAFLPDVPRPTIWYTLTLADDDSGLASIDAAIARGHKSGTANGLAQAYTYRAEHFLSHGNITEALDDLSAAFNAIKPAAIHVGVPHTGRALISACVAAGDLAEAQKTLDYVRAYSADIPTTFWADAEAELLIAKRLAAEALALATELRTECEKASMRNPFRQDWRTPMVHALHLLGDDSESANVAEEAVQLATQWGTSRAIGRALRLTALVNPSERVELLQRSVEVLGESDARYELAQSEFALGDALRHRRQMQDARTHLQHALKLAEICGAGALKTETMKTMRLICARPMTSSGVGPDALTPGEVRVAERAIEGLSNKEIAQGLFVTVKTVEVHLSNAFRKLGISRRKDLAKAMSAGGSRPDSQEAIAW